MRYIVLDENNKVIGVRNGIEIVEGEIESIVGEVGQILQPDGTFIDDPTPPPEPKSTKLEKLEQKINAQQEQIDQLTIALGDALLEGGI